MARPDSTTSLDRDYGYAFELSNSVVNPFT